MQAAACQDTYTVTPVDDVISTVIHEINTVRLATTAALPLTTTHEIPFVTAYEQLFVALWPMQWLFRQCLVIQSEKNYSLYEAYSADEAFLTGNFGAQTPVSDIDGKSIGECGAGPVTMRIRQFYTELVRQYVEQRSM